MAGPSLSDHWHHVGDGRTISFAYRSRVNLAGELAVYVDGALRTWPSDYSVTGAGRPDGGAVVFAAAPPAGASIDIEHRAAPETARAQVAAALAAGGALLDAAQARAAVDVTDHGAAGDGKSDDTAAIAAAEAARAPRQSLHFAAGTYRTRGNVVTKPGVWTFAPGATLRLADGQPQGAKLVRIDVDDVLLQGGVFDGNRGRQKTPTDQNCVFSDGRRNVHIDIAHVTGAGAQGVYMANATDCSVRVRRADRTGLTAIQWIYTGTDSVVRCVTWGSAVDRSDDAANREGCIKYSRGGEGTGKSLDCAVVDCHTRMHRAATGYGAGCIEFWGAGAYNRVIGCHADGSIIGISVANGQTSGVVVGNTTLGCAYEGIEIADSTRCTVSGNVVDGDGHTKIGISIDGANIAAVSNSVAGNTVRRTAMSGITFYRQARNSVASGNAIDITDPAGFGIRVLAASGVTVSGNAIDGGGTAAIGVVVDKASEVTLAGNRIANFAGQAVQVVNDRPGTIDNISIVGGSVERTGLIQFIASGGGTIGGNCAHRAVAGWAVGMASGAPAQGDVFDWAGFRGDFRARGVDPEGEFAAGVGSTYRRLDAAPGGQLWIKERGDGPTGWRQASLRLSAEATIDAAALAAGPVVIVPGIAGARLKLRGIVLTGVGGLAGGDRAVRIGDGRTVWSTLTAEAVRGRRPRFWGEDGVPVDSGAAATASSAEGMPITASYAGGTADYASGSIGLIVDYERSP